MPNSLAPNPKRRVAQKSRMVDNDDLINFVLVKEAAHAGDALAQFELGWMYAQGQGVVQSDKQAFKWYLKAAEQNVARAQIQLGWVYTVGRGVEADPIQAHRWYHRGIEEYHRRADQGEALAELHLGWLYESGAAMPRDYSLAVAWLKKAAEHGCLQAQFELGEMYYRGYGVSEDLVEAYKWFSLSFDDYPTHEQKGVKKFIRPALESFLTPEQISEGERRIAEFKSKFAANSSLLRERSFSADESAFAA